MHSIVTINWDNNKDPKEQTINPGLRDLINNALDAYLAKSPRVKNIKPLKKRISDVELDAKLNTVVQARRELLEEIAIDSTSKKLLDELNHLNLLIKNFKLLQSE